MRVLVKEQLPNFQTAELFRAIIPRRWCLSLAPQPPSPLSFLLVPGLELHEMRQAEANRQARQMIRNPSSVGTIFGGDGKPGVLHVLTVDDLCSPVGEQVSDV